MKNRPLIGIVLAFIAGILADNFLNIGFFSVFLITLTLSIISFCLLVFQRRECGLSLLLLTILTGIIYRHYVFFSSETNNISHLVENEKIPVRLCGIVLTNPLDRYFSNPSFSLPVKRKKMVTFLMQAEAAWCTSQTGSYGYERKRGVPEKRFDQSGEEDWKQITGIVKVNVYPVVDGNPIRDRKVNPLSKNENLAEYLKYGDRIELVGNISEPAISHNPGQFNYKKYLRRQRPLIGSIVNVSSEKNIRLLSENHGDYFFAFIYRLKKKLNTVITMYIREESAPLVRSILLGDRENVDRNLMESFLKTGTIHFLAISGLHVGILVVSLHCFLKSLRLNTKHSAVIIIIFTFLYTAITGMKTPILRAGIMVATYYGAYIFHRRWNLPNGIAAAVLLILFINPSDLFNVGFQLSVLAMLGIICFSSRIENCFWSSTLMIEKLQAKDERNEAWFLFKKYCRKTFCVSLAAWLAVMPLIAYYFHVVTPLAVLLNIVVLPFIWLILVGGFPVLLLGITFPMLVIPFASLVSNAEIALRHIILLLSANLKIFHYTAGTSWIWVLIYYLLALFFVLRKSFRIKREHMVIAALVVSNIFIFSGFFVSQRDLLKMTFFDVNHGTSIFIQFPNGKNMLFDAGTWSKYDVGESIVAPFLWKEEVKKIDTIVLSHEHDDHCNGIPSLIERFGIDNVFVHKILLHSGEKKELVKLIAEKKIPMNLLANGLIIKGYEPAKITVLNPPDTDSIRHDRFFR
ncbi:MAG: ComEC/Rec2 family competence protein [Candidatus Scalindua sp.]|nr:ComEC/Rec2 family competence protein [Candidatus Scalindua sp.]